MNNILFNNRFIFQETKDPMPPQGVDVNEGDAEGVDQDTRISEGESRDTVTGTEQAGRGLADNATQLSDKKEDMDTQSQRFTEEQIAEKTDGFELSNNERMFKIQKKQIQKELKGKPDRDLETDVAEEDIEVENADSFTTTTYGYKMLYVKGEFLLYREYIDEKETPKTEEQKNSDKSIDIARSTAWAEAIADEFLVDYELTHISEVPTKYIKLPKKNSASMGHEKKPKKEGGATTYYVVCQGFHKDYYVYKSDKKKEGARI